MSTRHHSSGRCQFNANAPLDWLGEIGRVVGIHNYNHPNQRATALVAVALDVSYG